MGDRTFSPYKPQSMCEPSLTRAHPRLPVAVLLSFLVITACGQAGEQAPVAARSVHLNYSAPEGDVYYNEMSIQQSVPGSYFMACGWDTGYFGLQQLVEPDEKVVLFSVWDPIHGDDPGAVKPEDRVEVLYSGDGVRTRRFGGEGTGAQCLGKCVWDLGATNRFVVQCNVESNKTAYTAWLWLPATNHWWKLATFRTRTSGTGLGSYHSFIEDFHRNGDSVHQKRRATYGNGWVRGTHGDWVALARARFTASNSTWESRDNIDAGVSSNWFYLATGGDISWTTRLQDTISRGGEAGPPPKLDFLSR
jgi:hypothetical protein